MIVCKVDKKATPEKLEEFICGRNKAFSARSNEHIPFSKENISILLREDISVYIADTDRETVGGFCIAERAIDRYRAQKILHVWVSVDHQGEGIASAMLQDFLNNIAEPDVRFFTLDVAHIYEPAIHLYKKLGFKLLEIYANSPKTYHFVRMIRSAENCRYPEIKRIFKLMGSYFRFYLLYHSDSTPNWFYNKIYSKLKDS